MASRWKRTPKLSHIAIVRVNEKEDDRGVWEEILARHPVIEVVGEPVRLNSNFVKGYTSLPVRIPA